MSQPLLRRAEVLRLVDQQDGVDALEHPHRSPLELGGAPEDVANLWPEPWTGDANAHMKDAVENFLNRQVCSGAPAEAQRLIATDWLKVYTANGLTPAQSQSLAVTADGEPSSSARE